MEPNQDIAIQITIKGVRLCITIEPDNSQTLPTIPVEIPLPEHVLTLEVDHKAFSNKSGIEQGHTKSPGRTKIQRVHNSTDTPKQVSPAGSPTNVDTLIKGYRVKVRYDESAPGKHDLLKSIILAGKKVQ